MLVADDHADVRQALALALRQDGFVVSAVADAWEAKRLLARDAPDVVLTDIRMPGDGMMLLREVLVLRPGTPVILMTAFEQPGDRRRALAAGATDFLVKPIAPDRLRSALRRALGR